MKPKISDTPATSCVLVKSSKKGLQSIKNKYSIYTLCQSWCKSPWNHHQVLYEDKLNASLGQEKIKQNPLVQKTKLIKDPLNNFGLESLEGILLYLEIDFKI